MSKSQISSRITERLADERLAYKTATVFGNAPLALIQLSLQVELHTLQRVLGVDTTNISLLRGES